MDVNVLRDTGRKVWRIMKKRLLGFVVAVMVFGLSAISSFAATGTVTAKTANIREKANMDSTVIASTAKGSKVDIVGAEKDSSGTVWYKVPVAGGSYGYVRADLIETKDTVEVSSSAASEPAATQEKPAATVPTAIGEQQATVKCDTNVKIRSGASTSHDVVTSLPNGTSITLIGEASDAAGNKWYQLKCSYNNKDIEGYIRSDLITIGAAESAATGSQDGEQTVDGEDAGNGESENMDETQQPEEEVIPEEPVEEHNDYEIVYMEDTNNPGEFHYYLYDNLDGTRRDVEVLLQAVSVSNENMNVLQGEVSRAKIIIIVLAVVIVLLFAGLTVLFIKLRGANDYDYEEDYGEEEVEDFEEPAPRKRRTRREEPVEEPVQRERNREQGRQRRVPRERSVEHEVYAEKAPAPQKAERTPRKAQNFLTDDDEFEFEFLNMDDKDL